MKLIKRVLIHILIIMLLLCSSISIIIANRYGLPIYADVVNDDNLWTPLNSEHELVDAFQSYCKSRDLTIEGSVADAVTTFTTGAFNSACNVVGVDITGLQAEIKKKVDSNGVTQYLFTNTGIGAMNRIFGQFLQDNELEVGDSANRENNTVYDGYMFTDDNGNRSLIWILNSTGSGSNTTDNWWKNQVVQKGTYLKYKPSDIYNAVQLSNPSTLTINANSNTYSFNAYLINGVVSQLNNYQYIGRVFYAVGANDLSNGYTNINGEGGPIAYCLASDTTRIRIGIAQYAKLLRNGSDWYTYYLGYIESRNITNNCPQTVIYFNTNNTVINNNNYEGDTIINNEGDIINNNNPSTDIPYNPYPDGGGTTSPPSSGGGTNNTINFPDIDLDLPSINWSLGDLSNKFPFSIPFDLLAFFTILNAPPQTPEFEGDLNLAIINHHFEFDLHQFDTLAELLRNLEFIGFCIGLIFITRQMLRV